CAEGGYYSNYAFAYW
nr:immunoglobulin heavy chain junction region [Mus musculus]